MTNSFHEVLDAECILMIGSNPTEAHPVFGTMFKRAKANGAKFIVVDPRKIELAEIADIYVPIKPGTNIAFANGVANVIYNEGLHDIEYIKERTEGIDEYLKVIEKYTPEYVGEICEIDPQIIRDVAHMYGEAGHASIFYTLGITEHRTGTRNVTSLSNLALLTGNIGFESAGINPIRGQNNVQGACDMGALPGDFPGYQKVVRLEVREKFSKAWGVTVPEGIGYTATETFDAMINKDVRALYIMGEDQATSDPNLAHVRKGLETVDFLVVQELFMTPTAEFADVILPAASYAEKNGTFTASERRVQRVRRAIDPIPGVKTDVEILCEISTRMGYPMHYNSYEEVFDEMASLTPSYSGLSYETLDAKGIQWPATPQNPEGTKFLHKDVMAGGVGLFIGYEHEGPGETPDEEFPLILSTGRNLYQYCVANMTNKTDGINEKAGESYIEMNPDLAKKYNMEDGETIEVYSRRGSINTKVRLRDGIREDTVWMPFHYQDGNSNELTSSYHCPTAKTPEYKACAVAIKKID